MPGTVTEGPLVSKSFANNFWGKDDAGFHPLLERMHNAKVTCDELKAFYNTRATIEDDYSRKLMALCRKPLGSCEAGTLRASLDVMRGEVESMGKSHQGISAQMKSELEEPLAAFAGGMKERRKIVQSGVEKLFKVKLQQTQAVNKSRDRYEQDCLKIKGYLAQGHMVMGQEERKNKAKMEKTQIQLASTSNDYEAAIKALEETTGRWNRDWKAACDKFQDLEEERLDFMKSSLWTFANIASTVCVSDDASCEKIRVSLESCEVEKDITIFIQEKGTGQEIPDPPKYINFCRGDLNDTGSEASEDESYSVAQFQRTINPAFRSSSPQPSVFESHHDPQSDLAMRMGHQESNRPPSRETTIIPQKSARPPSQIDYRRHAHRDPQSDTANRVGHKESKRPPSRETTVTPQKSARPPSQVDYRRSDHHDPQSDPALRMSHQEGKRPPSRETMMTPQKSARPASQIDYRRSLHNDPQSDLAMRIGHQEKNRPPSRETTTASQKSVRPISQIDNRRNIHQDHQSDLAMHMGHQESNRPPSRETTTSPQKFARPASQIDYRRQAKAQAQTQFQHSHIEALATVPHNEYPTDGMTMFCRTAPPSERSSAASPVRPSSRDSQSEYSIPTSFSSQDPASGKQSPVKLNTTPMISPTKEIQKKRSGFFSSNSPFRRKSKHEKEDRDLGATPILTPGSGSTWAPSSTRNIGSSNSSPTSSYARGNYSASSRDRCSGSPEPVDPRANFQLNVGPNVFDVASPDSNRNKPTPDPLASPTKEIDPIAQALAEIKLAEHKGLDKQSSTRISADRYHGIATPAPGTPNVSTTTTRQGDHAAAQHGTPPPSYHDQTPIKRLDPPKPAFTSAQMQQTTRKYVSQTKDIYGSPRPSTRGSGSEIPRATSPLPIRSVSPRPGYNSAQGQGQGYTRSASPNPQSSVGDSRRPQNSSPTKNTAGEYPRRGSANIAERAVSPQLQFARQERPSRAVSPQPQIARQERPSRAASPRPQFARQERPGSSSGAMALQLAEPGIACSERDRASTSRPLSYYGGPPQSHNNEIGRHVAGEGRTRSKSVADGRKYTQDGRPILHFARAMYVYRAAIPEELSFAKGDVLAVLRLQDDGWWEAEVTGAANGGRGGAGLVPSNYLQPC